jgi:hypothetical protein
MRNYKFKLSILMFAACLVPAAVYGETAYFLSEAQITDLIRDINANPVQKLSPEETLPAQDFLKRVRITRYRYGIEVYAAAGFFLREKAGAPRFIEAQCSVLMDGLQDVQAQIGSLRHGENRVAYVMTLNCQNQKRSFVVKVDRKENLSTKSPSFKDSQNYALLAERFPVGDPDAVLPFTRQWSSAEIGNRWVLTGELVRGRDLEIMAVKMTMDELSAEEVKQIGIYSYALGRMTGDFYFSSGGWLPGDIKDANIVWDTPSGRFVNVDYKLIWLPKEQYNALTRDHSKEALRGMVPASPASLFPVLAGIPARAVVETFWKRKIRFPKTQPEGTKDTLSWARITNLFLAGFFEGQGRHWDKETEKLGFAMTPTLKKAIEKFWKQKKKQKNWDPMEIEGFEELLLFWKGPSRPQNA